MALGSAGRSGEDHAEGWEVDEAENGRVALERLKESVPALVLLDLMMPEMDGFEFLEALREGDGRGRVPVVVITAKESSCPACRVLEGVEFTLDEAAQKMPIPANDCTHDLSATRSHGWCRCCYGLSLVR